MSVVLVFLPALERPYPLIPGEEYKVCTACEAIFTFIDKAIAAHSLCRDAGDWTKAIVVYDDGEGSEVHRSHTREMARA